MRAVILCLSACIVGPPKENDTGLEPDVDADGDSDTDGDGDGDSDSDTDGSNPWNAQAISFDFSGAIIGGEIVDGAILSGKRHDASFSLSLMMTDPLELRNCNVRYKVAGAPSSPGEGDFANYWRSWDFSALTIHEMSGECDSLVSVFHSDISDQGGFEELLAWFHLQMGLEDIALVDSSVESDWAEHWSFGKWEDDRPYLAAGGLYLLDPFQAAYEMNVFQGYAMDPETMEVEGDGFDLIPLVLEGAPDVPDGFYTSSPMYVIGTSW